jgi:hypothetical protein
MRQLSTSAFSNARKIDGHDLLPPDPIEQPLGNRSAKSVRPNNQHRIYFRDLAQMAWPEKTEANLAYITQSDPRTCRRWLANDTEPPAEALAAVLAEIMRRAHQR